MFYFILFYAIHNFHLFYHFTLDCIGCMCQLIIKWTCVLITEGTLTATWENLSQTANCPQAAVYFQLPVPQWLRCVEHHNAEMNKRDAAAVLLRRRCPALMWDPDHGSGNRKFSAADARLSAGRGGGSLTPLLSEGRAPSYEVRLKIYDGVMLN